MATVRSKFSISLHDSTAFARLSGDFNPLHVDPITARRTPFGGTVTHGIHLFLRALDDLEARTPFERREPAALSATFDNAVLTGATVSVSATFDGKRWRLIAEAGGRPAFTGSIELGLALDPTQEIEPTEFAPACPQDVDFPPAIMQGTVPLRLSRDLLAMLFPSLAKLAATSWIADLLGTTQIVGMQCPGMHSIYSNFRLRRSAQAPSSPATLQYRVEATEKRFQLMRIGVIGPRLTGTLETFFRPRPVAQPSMQDIATLVQPDTFVGHRALIIGGSRGLGELTAKILMTGGAETTITYARGQKDADRVCDEVRTLGRVCTAHHLDMVPTSNESPPSWLAKSRFSHVYFFASPPISRNDGPWNDALFQHFTDIYVTSFATLVGHMLATRSDQHTPMRFLYPSSIFVTHPEKGFSEYAVAKAAGEALCDQLQRQHDIQFSKPRLPRMRTDQTNSVVDISAISPVPIMLKVVRSFHS